MGLTFHSLLHIINLRGTICTGKRNKFRHQTKYDWGGFSRHPRLIEMNENYILIGLFSLQVWLWNWQIIWLHSKDLSREVRASSEPSGFDEPDGCCVAVREVTDGFRLMWRHVHTHLWSNQSPRGPVQQPHTAGHGRLLQACNYPKLTS